MWQAQAILRKSIRDTTAENDLEDPDKEFKDDSDSDAPQRNRGRGKGRGRGRGRARGRARGKHEEKAATTAGEALETLEARSQTECPEMPTHVLPKNLSSALDKAAQYVTNDMKEATVATHDHDNEEGQAKKEKQPTAAKSKASRAPPRKRRAATPEKEKKHTEPNLDNEQKAAMEAEHETSGPSSGSKPAETSTDSVTTPKKDKGRKQKDATPKKTPKTTPRKARKKKYQDSSCIYD